MHVSRWARERAPSPSFGRTPGAWRHALPCLALLPFWPSGLLAAALHAAPVPLAAVELSPLTLQQAVANALAHHPDVAAAARAIEVADGAALQAGLMPNPMLSASMEDARRDHRITALVLSQRLEMGGKRQARLALAAVEREAALAGLHAVRAGVQAEVLARFHQALAAQARLALARDNTAVARRALDAVDGRVQAGKASLLEQTRARLALAGVALEEAEADAAWRAAHQRLMAQCLCGPGRAAQLPLPLAGALALPPEPEWLDVPPALLERAPRWVQARARVALRDAEAALARSQAVPDLTVDLGGQRNAELGRTQALIGVSVPLPLFDRNQGLLREALARAAQARDELEATRLRLKADIDAAADRLRNARQRARLAEQPLLAEAQAALEATLTGFSLGKFGFLEVVDAQRVLAQARARHLQTLAEAGEAAGELDALLGVLLPEAEPASALPAPARIPSHAPLAHGDRP